MSESTRRGLALLVGAFALGAAGDAWLRIWPWGINAPLWTGALVLAMAAILLYGRPPLAISLAGRLLIVPTLAFAAAIAWRDSPVLVALNLIAVLIGLTLMALYSRAGRLAAASLTDYLLGAVWVGFSVNLGGFFLFLSDIHWPEIAASGRLGRATAVLRGIVLAVPLVALFGALLVAADAAFERFANSLVRFDVAELVLHALVIGVIGWVVAGWGRQLVLEDPWANPASELRSPVGIGMVEAGIVLGALDVLFLSFVVIQVGYLFGGAAFVEASASFTYSEYARRGFFELVTLAAISLPLLLGLHWIARPSSPRGQRVFVGLASGFLALLFVIMASAVVRMMLYTSLYGLTELRLYTTAFMGWLAVVFLWFGATVLRGKRRRFAVGALVSVFVAVGVLNALNPDALIARTNLSRIGATQPVDGRYLGSLSADAVPILVEGLPSLPDLERVRLRTTLQNRWSSASTDWRTWNLSRNQAFADVKATKTEPPSIATPGSDRDIRVDDGPLTPALSPTGGAGAYIGCHDKKESNECS